MATDGEDATRLTLRLGDGVEMAFRLIPAGEFRMGARGVLHREEPVHRVVITRAFWLATTPVTQQQYEVLRPGHENHFSGRLRHPAESMTWDDAVTSCGTLDQRCAGQAPFAQGWRAKLPSEAQWEYACRAGTQTEYHTGDGAGALAEAGWFDANSGRATHAVGLRAANAFGLHDMHGNVDEWCRDAWWEEAYRHRADGVEDPEVTEEMVGEENPARVLRGGSWDDSAGVCRAALRYRAQPGYWYWFRGFRVGLFPGPSCPDSTDQREGAKARRDAAQGAPESRAKDAPAGTPARGSESQKSAGGPARAGRRGRSET